MLGEPLRIGFVSLSLQANAVSMWIPKLYLHPLHMARLRTDGAYWQPLHPWEDGLEEELCPGTDRRLSSLGAVLFS